AWLAPAAADGGEAAEIAAAAGPGDGAAPGPDRWRERSAAGRCAATASARRRSGHAPSAAPGAGPPRPAPHWHTPEEQPPLAPHSIVAHSFVRERAFGLLTGCWRRAGPAAAPRSPARGGSPRTARTTAASPTGD